MEKTMEEAYFKAFQQLTDNCISYILQKELKQIKHLEFGAVLETTLLLNCSSIEELEKEIPNDYKQFQTANKPSEISKEIESNLDGITDQKERLEYLFSLLTPFKEICSVIHPTKHQPKKNTGISGYSWERLERSRQNVFESMKDTKHSVLSIIAERNKYYELSYPLPNAYRRIKEGTIEYYLHLILLNMENYANRLYAVLVKRGIDLKDIQNMAGIYLKSNWRANDIADYVGSMELAKYYLDRLHDEQPPLNDEQPAPAQQPNDEQPFLKDNQHAPRSTNKQQDNSHFTTGLSKDQLTTIFERLKDGRYLHADSVLEDWLIVCGAETINAPVKPLDWLKAQNILAWLIDQLFEDFERWEITAKCFTVKGKAPNTNSMKNEVSKVKGNYKSKPTEFMDLERLLKG